MIAFMIPVALMLSLVAPYSGFATVSDNVISEVSGYTVSSKEEKKKEEKEKKHDKKNKQNKDDKSTESGTSSKQGEQSKDQRSTIEPKS